MIDGVPYAQKKPRGDQEAPGRWSDAVRERTRDLPKLRGPCELHVLFLLPQNKFPDDYPYGSDLDNLLKRFLDALNETLFSEVQGKDSCVVRLSAAKRRVSANEDTGAFLTITPGCWE